MNVRPLIHNEIAAEDLRYVFDQLPRVKKDVITCEVRRAFRVPSAASGAGCESPDRKA